MTRYTCSVVKGCTHRVWVIIDVSRVSRDLFQPIPTCRTHSRAAIDAALVHTKYPIVKRVDQ